MRSTVDLPQPDGPTSTMNSPGSTARSSSRTASTPPRNRLPTFSSRSATAGRRDEPAPGAVAAPGAPGPGADVPAESVMASSLERPRHEAAHEEPPEHDVDQQGRQTGEERARHGLVE